MLKVAFMSAEMAKREHVAPISREEVVVPWEAESPGSRYVGRREGALRMLVHERARQQRGSKGGMKTYS
jgi:hypothetical protein